MTLTTPPADSIFSRAYLEKPCAEIVSFLPSSPSPRIFTGMPLRVARPFARSSSGPTEAPSSKRASRSLRFTGCVLVRPNCSNGIDFFMCGPRSLRIRMWTGIWPPSRLTRSRWPERAPAPLWPRPEVLPKPEPSPRPMRFLRWREPGAGFRLWRPIVSSSAICVHLHEVLDGVDRTADRRIVGLLGGAADLAEAERAERVALLL